MRIIDILFVGIALLSGGVALCLQNFDAATAFYAFSIAYMMFRQWMDK